MRISLDHMAGVFIVLAGGIVLSVVFLLIERRCRNLRKEVKRAGVSPSKNKMFISKKVLNQIFREENQSI